MDYDSRVVVHDILDGVDVVVDDGGGGDASCDLPHTLHARQPVSVETPTAAPCSLPSPAGSTAMHAAAQQQPHAASDSARPQPGTRAVQRVCTPRGEG